MIRSSALNITAFLLLRMFVEVSSKVYFFTYLTAVTNSMPCSSIRSALSNGIQLTVLGLPKHGILGNSGSIILDPTECNTIELLKHLEYGKGFIFSPDDIVVFNDGTDVLYAGNEDQVEAAFVTIEKNDTILFSSERTCWPGTIPCIELDKSIPSSFKYANSGGFIARYQVMMKFLPLWVKLLGAQSGGLRDDQLALHHYQTESNQHSGIKTEIDHNCTIFQTTSGTNLQTSKWAVSDPVGPYVRSDGTIYNSETRTHPLFIHFNRNNERMSSIERSMAINHHKRMENESKYEKNCKSLMRKNPFIRACETEEKISRSIKFSCHAEDNPDGTTEFNAPDQASSDESVWFPSRIFPFNIRRDVTSGRPVSRNRVKLLDPEIRYTVKEYNKILQCARVQPELHGKGGALSLARYIPLTSNTLTLVAAFLESNCRLWIDCYPQVKRMMSGKYSDHLDNTASLSGLSSAVMFRIMNGSLYTDWPWGSHRFKKNHDSENDLNYKFIIREVVGRVSDLPDSVFFAAGEIALLPSNIPMPLFSSSPSGSTSSDIPGMWNQAYQIEVQRYRNGVFNSTVEVSDQRLLDLHTSNSSNAAIPPPSTWTQRKDKAAFFGSMTDDGFIGQHVIARQVVINIALEHPEDVEALYNLCFQLTGRVRYDISPSYPYPPHYLLSPHLLTLVTYSSLPNHRYQPCFYGTHKLPLQRAGMGRALHQ